MTFTKTQLAGVYLIRSKINNDTRGYFTRIFAKEEFKKRGISFQVLHINRSLTKRKGTIRGLHFQKNPYSETKIVQCLRGKIFDVVVDVRPKSKTFGLWFGTELNEKNNEMLLIPKGFAHGFQILEDDCEMLYLMSQTYHPETASGVRWNDPMLKISWPIKSPHLSPKDKNLPLLSNIKTKNMV